MNDLKTSCDVMIRGAFLITVDESRRIIPDGAIAITARRIEVVGKTAELDARYAPKLTVDAEGGVVHPGFVEPHIHISQFTSRTATGVFFGENPPHRYAEWKANIFEEDEGPATALGCLRLTQAGFTSFVDPGTVFAPDVVAETAAAAGMRGWLCDPYLWDFGDTLALYPALISPNLMKRVPCDHERLLKELGGQLHRNTDEETLIRGHVSVYGEATASDALRQAAKACATENGVTFTEHLCFSYPIAVAEDKRLGMSQVQHAADLGIMDSATTGVHMNFLRDGDAGLVKEAGISVIWCAANYLFGAAAHGCRTQIPALYREGVNVGLAIDTPNHSSPGDSALMAYFGSREAGDPVDVHTLMEMQTIGAARTIGAEDEIGSLAAGKKADIVIRRTNDPSDLRFDAVNDLMLHQRAASVRTVLIDGQIVYQDGVSSRADEDQVVAEARASTRRIIDRIGLTPSGSWPVVQ